MNDGEYALRDVLTNKAKSLGRRILSSFTPRSPLSAPGSSTEEFYALKDVSFEINQGERVGIIGRNGAGKSTLLKILSRITEPTKGRIEITGRVASLLEVGTGFHPELTGRENIFLNGAILGMTKAEIKKKFDEIVAFAEIEKFLDTPVKRYSSGMYVRLAFAVAAHLEPEILIVDEVLAVGDAQFQKKCLGKMEDVGKEGRTILFVSHNMGAVRSLCHRGIVLDGGMIRFIGDAERAIAEYSSDTLMKGGSNWLRPETLLKRGMIFKKVSISLHGDQPRLRLHCDITLICNEPLKNLFLSVDVCDATLTPIMQALPDPTPFIKGIPGEHQVRLDIELPPLIPGHYCADFWIGAHFTNTQDYVKNIVSFDVTQSPTLGRNFPHYANHGFLAPICRYSYIPPDFVGI
jgi:lipopolysaccharide transport system ATP-binding protein